MIQTDKILEFDKIKEKWSELAFTEYAKERIRDAVPYLSENELRARLRETSEARILIEKNGNPPLVSLNGIREYLQVALKGECLSISQIEDIEKALVAVMRLKNYLNRSKQWDISLSYYDEGLDCLENLKETINLQIRNGNIDDNASKELKSLRTEMEQKERNIRMKADTFIRKNKDILADSFSTWRNGHLCVPVKKEYKYKLRGSVIDQSSTGSTLFMEPLTVSKQIEELQFLRLCAENEEKRILYSLSALIADDAEKFEQNIRTIEKLDYVFSKGKLSIEYGGSEPKINTKRYIMFRDGRHPLMKQEDCVPLQFEIGKDFDGVIITGPNTGGKTVAIKTVALNCMMAQCGLHVACKEADICMNDNFLCDIGDGQNLSENLSTFSSHIVNVLEILRKVSKESLVVMDELGSGTDPTEGMGIAIAILEELRKSGALFLVTTHYPEVKQYADKQQRIKNARMTFDKESLKPLYQLIIGEAGESCAFYIAGKMGMPEEMLRMAMQTAYGNTDLPENLRNVISNNQLLKEKHLHIQKIKTKRAGVKKERDYQLGDSVLVYPEKKIGIVCKTANEKGVLRVQMADKKIWINHKRIKLHVAADELYPEDYDFSIIFESVQNRKLKHQIERGKFITDQIMIEE